MNYLRSWVFGSFAIEVFFNVFANILLKQRKWIRTGDSGDKRMQDSKEDIQKSVFKILSVCMIKHEKKPCNQFSLHLQQLRRGIYYFWFILNSVYGVSIISNLDCLKKEGRSWGRISSNMLYTFFFFNSGNTPVRLEFLTCRDRNSMLDLISRSWKYFPFSTTGGI